MPDKPSRVLRTIPAVHELTVAEAYAALEAAGFRPVASPRRFGAGDATGVVRGTLPPEGAAAPAGSRVDLLPAASATFAEEVAGPTPAEEDLARGVMPDLRGLPGEEAGRILETAGFRTWPRDAVSLDVDPGLVVTTDPRPGAAVVAGGLVLVHISEGSGPPPEPVEPPVDEEIEVPIPRDFLEPKPD